VRLVSDAGGVDAAGVTGVAGVAGVFGVFGVVGAGSLVNAWVSVPAKTGVSMAAGFKGSRGWLLLGMVMLMPLGIGSGSPSNSIGKTMTTASTKATAPVKRRLALTRNEAAWASLETEGRGLAA